MLCEEGGYCCAYVLWPLGTVLNGIEQIGKCIEGCVAQQGKIGRLKMIEAAS